uniref:EGF-like domain-containing protein n=1 Tax=Panagrellus redivivus TaxID=6233 RepID=A0A7E4W1K2_PANRE
MAVETRLTEFRQQSDAMRIFSAALLCGLIAAFAVPAEAEWNIKWVTAFNSFFENGTPGIAVQSSSPDDSLHARIKRSVYAAMGWKITCDPGWTGFYCESPVCWPEPPLHFSGVLGTRLIDRVDLGPSCERYFVFPVEFGIQQLTITVSISAGTPTVTLYDDNQFEVTTTGTSVPQNGIFMVDHPPTGLYSLNVSTGGAQSTSCHVNVEALTLLDVVAGFTGSAQNDIYEDEVLYSEEPSFFIAHPFNLSLPGELGAVKVRINNRENYAWSSALNKRYDCNHEYYAGYYTCEPGQSDYYWVVEGTDSYGNRFRRSKPFYCINRPTPPTPPTTPVIPVESCLNGGSYVNITGEPFCFCGTYFTGRDCSERVCMNDGTPTRDGCDCQEGFTGDFCENVFCNTDAPASFTTEEKTLILVVRRSPTVASKINDIVQSVSEQIAITTESGSSVYSWFVLATFANGQHTWMEYSSASVFLRELAALNTTDPNFAANCSDSVIDAVSAVFNAEVIENKSPIYIITDVPASDGDNYLTIVNRNTFRKLPIFSLVIQDPASTCNVDVMSPGYRALRSLSESAGGLVLTPSLIDVPNAVRFTLRYTGYHRQFVAGYDYIQCNMGNLGAFFADSSTRSITIFAVGQNLSIDLTDPNGQPAILIDSLVADQYNYVFELFNTIPGEYLFRINTLNGNTAPCSYRVYIESDYDLFYGVSNSLSTDAIFSEPIYNYPSNIVASLSNFHNRVRDPARVFSELQISRANRSGHLEPVYYSNGVFRDGCNYHFHFGAFSCDTPHEHLYLTLFADDQFGFPIQRSAILYCAYVAPTPEPSNTCINGGVVNPLNTSSCICPQHWSGTFCDKLQCDNGGRPVNDYFCECPPGTDGRYCQLISCNTPATGLDFGFTHRSLAFVLNVHNSMAPALTNIASKVHQLVRELHIMHNQFITQYVVITYSDDATYPTVTKTDNSEHFISAVLFAAEQANSSAPATNCTGPIDNAINLAVDNSFPSSYIWVFTDSEGNEPNSDLTYANAMLNAQDLKIEINLVGTTQTICGSPDGKFSTKHRELVGYTEGDGYYTTHPENILAFIPTYFKSGQFTGGASSNSTCNVVRYVPVDYWAKSFTVHANGKNVKVSVTPPDGSTESSYLNSIDSDDGFLINQYIIPCDTTTGNYWSVLDQYCYSSHYNVGSRDDADRQCHSTLGAHLLQIFDKTTEDDIAKYITGTVPVWIGLRRVGNTSTFEWDAPPNAPYNHTLFGYTNWDPTANQNDPSTGDCVVIKPGTQGTPAWFTTPCNSNYSVVCQKHRYDQDNEGAGTQNLLPAGLWKVSITADDACYFKGRIQSEIQIFYGFVNDIHSDERQSYANLESDSNRIIATATSLEPINPNNFQDDYDGRLDYAFLYYNRTLLGSTTFQFRTKCAYTAVSQTFKCPQYGTTNVLSEMPVRFSGIDQFGNLFERIATPYCSKTIASCFNGGFKIGGQCVCPPYFSGDRCQVRECLNGGELMPNGECFCSEETSGDHCEHFRCVPPRKHDFSDEGKTLAILVQTSPETSRTLLFLSKKLESIISNVVASTSSTWFTNYILVPFDSTSNKANWINKTYSPDIKTIADAMGAIPLNQCPGGTCDNSCPRPILSVLNDTLNDPQFVTPNSVVLLISPSTVEDIAIHTSVYQNVQRTKAQIQVVVPDIASPCGLGWNDPTVRGLFSLPQASGGNFFTVRTTDLINTLLPQYLPSLYRSAVVDSLVIRNCTRDEIFFSIDSSTPEVTILYNGANPQVTVVQPDGTTQQLNSSLSNSANSFFAVFQTAGKGGTYRLVATSDSPEGACLLNVHADSTIEIYAGYVIPTDAYNGATSDEAHWVAIADPAIENVVMLHAANIDHGSIDFVQLYSTQAFGRSHLWSAEVKRRSSECSYEWYSVGGFTCNAEGSYQLAIYGTDNKGFNFRRSIPVHCLADRPPRPPTPPTCDLSTRYYDILLLIDGSSADNFATLKNVAASTFSQFTLSSNATRISTAVINANATLANQLVDSDAYVHVQPYFDTITTAATSGQDLADGLQYGVTLATSATSGYRADARHLVVYLTQNAAFTGGDPVETILSLSRSGAFGFVAVGLELNDTNNAQLSTLTNEFCRYSASGNTAAVQIANFVGDLTCFRRPVCGE